MRFLRLVLSPLLSLLLSPVPALLAQAGNSSVTLSPATSPAAGEPGVTLINVTGTGFPAGSIPPNLVTVNLQPVTAGSGPALTGLVTAVTTVVGSTRRITFQVVPGNPVQAPTAYLVSVAGSTAAGGTFSSANTSALTVNPPASIALSVTSGQPGQSLAVTITGSFSIFFQGSTQASFGPGVSVGGAAAGVAGPVTVSSPTSAVAQLVIDPAAAAGLRDVSVRTGAELATLPGGSA